MTDQEIFTGRLHEAAQLVGISFTGTPAEIPRLDFYLKEMGERIDEMRRAARDAMAQHQQLLPDSMRS